MECKFSDATHEEGVEARLDTKSTPIEMDSSTLDLYSKGGGDIDEDTTHYIGAAWMKRRFASGILCDKKVSL